MNELSEGNTFISCRNPEAVKKALQKVTNFTRFLEFCKCQFGKSKEAERFSIVDEGHYVRYGIINARVSTWTSIHRAVFYILRTKDLE